MNLKSMVTTLAVAALWMSPAAASAKGGTKMNAVEKSGYAASNGVKVYYEVHGDGPGTPLVLLHGSFMTNDTTWSGMLPSLSKSRKVIAIELRGHGHSSDSAEPFTFPAMADDVAAVLGQLDVKRADVLGYSMGGTVAAGVALRHPELVRKLIVVSAALDAAGWEPQSLAQIKGLPADFAPKPLVDAYDKVAPDPKHWPVLVQKVQKLITQSPGWSEAELRGLKVPVLLVMGDRDGFRTERAIEVSRLVPQGQVGVIPGGDHFFLWSRADVVLPMVQAFIDAAS